MSDDFLQGKAIDADDLWPKGEPEDVGIVQPGQFPGVQLKKRPAVQLALEQLDSDGGIIGRDRVLGPGLLTGSGNIWIWHRLQFVGDVYVLLGLERRFAGSPRVAPVFPAPG